MRKRQLRSWAAREAAYSKEEVRQRIMDHTGEVMGGGVEAIGVIDTTWAQGIKACHRPWRGEILGPTGVPQSSGRI